MFEVIKTSLSLAFFFFFLQGPRLLEDLEAGLRGDGHGVESGSCTSPNVTWQS